MIRTLLACLLFAAALRAGNPVVLDTGSRLVFDEWFKKEYHLGRAGARAVVFDIKAIVAQEGEPYTLKGKYKWDGTLGKLDWEDPRGHVIERAGLGTATFDMWMSPDGLKHLFPGCKLNTTRDESVKPPGFILTVAGPSKSNVRTLRFTPECVLVGMGREITLLRAQVPVTIRFMYKRADDEHWLLKEVRSEAVHGGRKGKTTTRFWHKRVGKFQVVQRIEQSTVGAVDGRPGRFVLELFNYRINEAGAKAEAKPTPKK